MPVSEAFLLPSLSLTLRSRPPLTLTEMPTRNLLRLDPLIKQQSFSSWGRAITGSITLASKPPQGLVDQLELQWCSLVLQFTNVFKHNIDECMITFNLHCFVFYFSYRFFRCMLIACHCWQPGSCWLLGYWGLLTTGIVLITRLLGFADNWDRADY